MNLSALISTALCLFILMAIGYLARKRGIITDESSKGMSTLIIKIGQPALIIHSFTSTPYSADLLREAGMIVLLGFALHIFAALYAYLSCRPVRDLDERKLSEFSLIFANCGFIGFPILESVMGEKGLFWGGFFLVSFFLVHWTWGILILARGRTDIRPNVRKIFINSGTVPCAIALGIYLLRIPLPVFVTDAVGYLASLCTPISMLISGALLATIPAKQLFGRGQLYLLCLHKLVILPVLVCVVMVLLGMPVEYTVFTVIMAALPSAAVVTMFAEVYGIKPAFAATAEGLTTLLSVVSLPCVMWLTERILS